MAFMLLKMHAGQLPPMICRFVFNPDKASYTAGDTLTGELHLSCEKDVYSFGLRLALEGTAMVKLKDHGVQSKTASLLKTSTYVYGTGEQRIRLQPADHTFPFSLEIPAISPLPGSFRSPFGIIIYQLVVYVQLERNFVRKAEKTICVSSYLSLSHEPSLSTPVSYEKTEKSLLPSLISRRLTPHFRFNFRMTQSGFQAGEEIPFELELDNPAAYEIASMMVTLLRKVTYSAGTAWKVKLKIVGRKETNHMDSPNGTLWTESIQVPSGAHPNQKGIIEINYFLKIEVRTTGQATPLRGEVPITIGTTREPLVQHKRGSHEELKASSEEAALLKQKQRERSPSPCPLNRVRSSRVCHKSLDRADSVATHSANSHAHPPRYSLLSIRSSSVETLPPTYEDALQKVPKSPEVEAAEIEELKKFVEEEDDAVEGEEEEDEVEETNLDDESPIEEGHTVDEVDAGGEVEPPAPEAPLAEEETSSMSMSLSKEEQAADIVEATSG